MVEAEGETLLSQEQVVLAVELQRRITGEALKAAAAALNLLVVLAVITMLK